MGFHSGVRLKLAKELKSLTWQEIASAVNRTDSAVKKWVKDKIRDSSISAVANFFEVDDWVFSDECLSKENFKKIIHNPSLQDEFLPESALFKFKGKGRRGGQKSEPFVIDAGSILMSVRLLGVDNVGIKDTQFSISRLNICDAEQAQRSWNHAYANETLYINIKPEDVAENEVVKEKIVEIFNKQEFYISAMSQHDFEVSVYEMTAYLK